MTTTVETIYERGVFLPTRPIALREGTQVEVIVPETEPLHDPREAARLLAEIAAKAPRSGKSETASVDHDKILYGPKDAR